MCSPETTQLLAFPSQLLPSVRDPWSLSVSISIVPPNAMIEGEENILDALALARPVLKEEQKKGMQCGWKGVSKNWREGGRRGCLATQSPEPPNTGSCRD